MAHGRQLSAFGHFHDGDEGLGRQIVVGVAVREHKGPQALRVLRSEDLGDRTPGIVRDEIDLL